MNAIVGLGNPGKEYERTPHNAGFMVLDELAGRLSCAFHRSLRFPVRSAKAVSEGEKLLLLKPVTFMNNSGRAVSSVMSYHRLSPQNLIVVLDDADLSVGQLRIRRKGSSGGHKGLASVIQEIRSEDFARVRVGIGRSGEDLIRHVLKPLSREDWPLLQEAVGRAADAVLFILERGVDQAMNNYNAREN